MGQNAGASDPGKTDKETKVSNHVHLRHLRLVGIIEDFTYLDGTYMIRMHDGEIIRLTEDEAPIFVRGAMYAARRVKNADYLISQVEIDDYFQSHG